MGRITYAIAAGFALCAFQAQAATLEVGAGKRYTTLSAAAAAAQSYDTIIVYPGTYSGAAWTDSNLTIKRAAGTATGSVVVTGATVGDKGLFLVKGANVTIDGLRFTGARSTSRNGAGIRAEGKNLTVRNSEFIANENGMLITPGLNRGVVTISNSLFKNNGYGDGQSHGLYASSGLDKLVVTGSRFEGTKVGHHLKSRADVNVVRGSSFIDGSLAKAASYQIDLSEGGAATIEGNTLVKGVYSSNGCCSIALGFEQYKGGSYVNPPGLIVIRNNKFTNQRSTTTTFVVNRTVTPATLTTNSFTGRVKPLTGPGSVDGLIS